MQTTESRQPSAAPTDDARVRAAFHELHGRSLHGFALLLVLGDQGVAARLAGRALGLGAGRLDELRHPERAAAWLRAEVVRSARPLRSADLRPSAVPLGGLGAGHGVIAGLAALSTVERAGLIASHVERLDPRDVAVIVRRDGSRLRDLLRAARRRYLAAFLSAEPEAVVEGPVADQLRDVAVRTIG